MNGMIHFKCTKCGTRVRVPREMAGKKGRCPKCQTIFPIPGNPPAGSHPEHHAEPTDKVEVFELQVSSSLDQLAAVTNSDSSTSAHQYQVPPGAKEDLHAPPPQYNSIKTFASVLQVFGVFCWMGALCVTIFMFVGGHMETSQYFTFGILLGLAVVLGVLCYAMGEAFNCIRDIARNTFKH